MIQEHTLLAPVIIFSAHDIDDGVVQTVSASLVRSWILVKELLATMKAVILKERT